MLVNGEKIELDAQKSLYDFLLEQNFDPYKIAVEYNGKAISRASFQEIRLDNSDVIEIVCFVGGG